MTVRPRIVAICDTCFKTDDRLAHWYTAIQPSIQQITCDYNELLGNPEVEAVYCAVPHHLHQDIYCAAIEAGKHLMGEKPFGIDRVANDAILSSCRKHPQVFVRCSSEFPFFPAVQRLGDMLDRNAFGRIIEVNTGLLHSSDLDPLKPINWKRIVQWNGEYGCLGDLGMHACHVPFRANWKPRNVRAILSNIVPERPDGLGGRVPCETWDNAILLCAASSSTGGELFPWILKSQRISPGETNTWYIDIKGTNACVRFTTKSPKTLFLFEYHGGEQIWQQLELGHETAFKSVTDRIFEFGFSDAILQMWAAFLYELSEGKPLKRFASCVRPEETALAHQLFTAALISQREGSVVALS
jgi:predicted dehydrogenase